MKLQTATLGELCYVRLGKTPDRDRREYWRGPYPWAAISDMDRPVIQKTAEGITDLAISDGGCAPVEAGTLLLSFKLSLGKVAFAGRPLFTNEAIAALPIKKPSELDPRYLYYRLQAVDWASLGRRAVKGNCLNKDILSETKITYPEIHEQRRIAGQLERADRLRRTRRYALVLSDTFLPAAFVKMFGDDGFPVATVEELAGDRRHAIRTGPFGSQLLHSEFTDSGIAVLGIDNAVNNRFEWAQRRFITRQKYEQLKRYTVFPGDVIITLMGTCGRCAIVPDNIPAAINTKHLCCITLDRQRCLPVYLHGAFLYHPHVRHQLGASQKGAIMEGLNMEIIKNLKIPVPPVSLQARWAGLVVRHERLRSVQREALRQADHLFQTLLQEAFTEGV